MLNRIRILSGIAVALFTAGAAISRLCRHENFHGTRAHAGRVWSVNGVVIDEKGEHDLSPKTEDDWERVVSGAATLAEATNALMIPERALDPAWSRYAKALADAANKAYQAAEAHDLKAISQVSDQLDGICAACHRHYGVE